MSAESIYRHGFARVAAAVPTIRVGGPAPQRAADDRAGPRRRGPRRRAGGLPRAGPVRLQRRRPVPPGRAAGRGARRDRRGRRRQPVAGAGARGRRAAASREQRLFNCAVVVHRGRVLGRRAQELPAQLPRVLREAPVRGGAQRDRRHDRHRSARDVPFGTDLLFEADRSASTSSCTWRSARTCGCRSRRSTYAAMAGATVLANLSASNITVGKADYRRMLCDSRSRRACIAAYLYTAAGAGRVDHRHGLGRPGAHRRERRAAGRVASASPTSDRIVTADVDLERLVQDRIAHDQLHRLRRATTASALRALRRVGFELGLRRRARSPCSATSTRFPYVPADPAQRDERCDEAYRHPGARADHAPARDRHRQARDRRLRRAGLDPRAARRGAGDGRAGAAARRTSSPTRCRASPPPQHTLDNAHAADGRAGRDRAGDRHPPVGRADAARPRPPGGRRASRSTTSPTRTCRPASAPRTCSAWPTTTARWCSAPATCRELALGWCTYGVGDQMSHYNVNASVPKTLIQYLDPLGGRHRPARRRGQRGAARGRRHRDLARADPLPGRARASRATTPRASSAPTSCRTSSSTTCCASASGRRKVAFLAHHAWGDRERGDWPELVPPDRRNEYDDERDRALARRVPGPLLPHVASSSAARCPTRPKVGSGGSLSPRGDWRAPSDGNATAWLEELRGRRPD